MMENSHIAKTPHKVNPSQPIKNKIKKPRSSYKNSTNSDNNLNHFAIVRGDAVK